MFERRDPMAVLEGVWSGHYYYPKIFGIIELSAPVKFTAVFERNDDALGGRIFEPNTFGGRSAEHLEADMKDVTLAEDHTVSFIKKYNGMGGARHKVHYKGTLSPDGVSIAGRWRISFLGSGTFEIFKEDLSNRAGGSAV